MSSKARTERNVNYMKEFERKEAFMNSLIAINRAENMIDAINARLTMEKTQNYSRRRDLRIAWEWTEKTHKAHLTAESRHAENMVILLSAEKTLEILQACPWTLIASNGEAIPFTDSPRFAGDRLRLRGLLEEALGHRDNNLRGYRDDELAYETESDMKVIASVFRKRGRKARLSNNGSGKKTVTIDNKYKIIEL